MEFYTLLVLNYSKCLNGSSRIGFSNWNKIVETNLYRRVCSGLLLFLIGLSTLGTAGSLSLVLATTLVLVILFGRHSCRYFSLEPWFVLIWIVNCNVIIFSDTSTETSFSRPIRTRLLATSYFPSRIFGFASKPNNTWESYHSAKVATKTVVQF